MSWTVMVWVAELLLPASCRSERANDGVVARSIASSRLTGHLDGHLTAVVRHGVVQRHLVRALNRVVGRDEVNSELWCPEL